MIPGTFEGIPNHVWLYLSAIDSSFRLHCILSAINHCFRDLLMKGTTRLCWSEINSRDRPNSVSALFPVTRPPFALILRRRAASLEWLTISDPFDAEDAAAFVEDDLKGAVFPQLRTLNFPRAPLWFLRLVPQLRDLTINQAAFPSRRSFYQFLRDRPSLQSLEIFELSLLYFGLRGQRLRPYRAMVRAAAGEGIEIGTPGSVRGLTLEQSDPEDLPLLLADWPNMEHLRVTFEELTTDPLGVLAAAIQPHAPNLQLELSLNHHTSIMPHALQPFDSVLTSLSASVVCSSPRLVLPATLRVCDLVLLPDLAEEVTLDLPHVEELTLKVSKPLNRVTLCCPALGTFRARTNNHPRLISCFAAEGRMPLLGTLEFGDSELTIGPGESLDLDGLWKNDLPDFWRVRNLELAISLNKGHISSHLRVPPSVKRLVVSTRSVSGGLINPLEMSAPQLEELEVRASMCTTINFSGGPPLLHTLSVLDTPPSPSKLPPALFSLIHQCQKSLKRLVLDWAGYSAQVPLIEECPVLQQLWCKSPIGFRSRCPFLDRLGLTAPTVYRPTVYRPTAGRRPPPPKTALDNAALTPIRVLFVNIEEDWNALQEDGPLLTIVRIKDPVPSVLLDRLRQDRPDVLIFSCPCISDALLLRTFKTPNLRPLYAQDLASIIQQSGAPVRVVLHHSEHSGWVHFCLPYAFLGDLFEIHKQQGLLLTGEIKVDHENDLPSFFRCLAEMGIASAVESLKESRIYDAEAFAFEGHLPPPHLLTPRRLPLHQYAQELQAHFANVTLGELEGALERRGPAFCCQCQASTPPQFRVVWSCTACSDKCPDHDLIDNSIVLPDPGSTLSCLPIIRENASQLVSDHIDLGVPNFCFRCLLNSGGAVLNSLALPLAECVGCHTRGLRMRSDALAALPPFDERPSDVPPHPRPRPPFPDRPVIIHGGAVGQSQAPPPINHPEGPALRVLCITLNPNPAIDNPRLEQLSTSALQEISAALKAAPQFGFEVSLLCEPSTRVLKAKMREFRPDLVVYLGHGLPQAVSIRGEEAMTKPLTWIGPDEFLSCFGGATPPAESPLPTITADHPTSTPLTPPSPLSVPHTVLLLCCNSLALGDHLLRGLSDSGGLERVVATADELADVEASRFISTLLAYAPHNPIPATLDKTIMLAFRHAQQARATLQDPVDPTTPLVLISSHSADNAFSRGPTLAEALHATRALARPLESIPLRRTCGCPEGPQFAIEYAHGCVRPAVSEGPTTLCTAQEQREGPEESRHHGHVGVWCLRCIENVAHDRALLPYAQRCKRCGQAAFIIPCDLPSAFGPLPAATPGREKDPPFPPQAPRPLPPATSPEDSPPSLTSPGWDAFSDDNQ
ncbi:hypothetical protein PAPYR_8358 [Paratrimastix pyriformis]|uniref:CHAT domain-containing protein n=1 Tax=Paratrimastix pyriformis TaxID=342808 RepID=A0ABQ8UGE1_9EUKA|nr:hypothetical protein PAPYR_8358 [Paratrimastix pyriformis]